MHKVLIASSDPTIMTWKSLPSKVKEIEDVLNTAKGEFDVDVAGVYVKPEVKDGRITHKWFNTFSYPLYRKGYDFVLFHMGDKQRTELGIKPTLRGSSQDDTDFVGEMYFWADENTLRKGYNQFVETSLHELSHEIARGTQVKDRTHEQDKKKNTVKALFKKYDMSLYLPLRQSLLKEKGRLEKILEALLSTFKAETFKPFFDKPYRITQRFGVLNPMYTQTGTHIGTDYATPKNTPIYAPYSGTLEGTEGRETGLIATLNTKHGSFQFLHCEGVYPNGSYTQGQIIGYTGNTGTKTTGSHCCVRLWKGKPNLSVLTKNNVHTYLSDVTLLK